ncbi:hypothetical protein HA466_0283570 [Hirschfeldia incana]|nr:hypothetical protein HA466_0283570 [Hirschfeldia incana]
MNNRRGTTTTTTAVSNPNRRLQRRQVIHVLPDETALRVVCHASVIGGIIGSNGRVVSKLRRETGAKIHCESPATNGSDHWVVFIVGSTAVDKSFLLTDRVGDYFPGGEGGEGWVTCEVSRAQAALIRVLERSWVVLAAKDSGGVVVGDDKEAYCGLLADRSQIGAVMGLKGKNVEWMRRNSGATIRVLPPPVCGANSDELIQITGDVLAVKKALVMVSTFLQNSPPLNGYQPPLCSKAYEPSSTNGNSEDPHSEFFPNLRSSSLLPNNVSEAAASTSHSPSPRYEEGNSFQGPPKDTDKKVVFKIICTSHAAGGIIGKQGTIIRALQNETGASISFGAPLKASGERVVTISARESLESRFSQSQKALVRVFTRSIEIDVGKGLLPSALVKAKLLVPSRFADDLIGNKEAIISTDVDVHISVGGQTLDCVSENEMVIEIMGEYRHVQKALSHVSSKLRENLLPTKDLEAMRDRVGNPYENGGANYNLQPSDGEQDVKMVRSGTEAMKHTEAVNEEVNGFTPTSLLESDLTQGMKELQLSSNGDISFLPPRSKGVSLRNVTLELAVEKDALAALYGRDGGGLDNLQQISGARVDVRDAPTEVETIVSLSGNPEQARTAMSLIVSILDDH